MDVWCCFFLHLPLIHCDPDQSGWKEGINRSSERERGLSYSEHTRNILYTDTHIWTHQQTNSVISVGLEAVVRKNQNKWGLFNYYYTIAAYRKGYEQSLNYWCNTYYWHHILINIILHIVSDSLVPGLKLSFPLAYNTNHIYPRLSTC